MGAVRWFCKFQAGFDRDGDVDGADWLTWQRGFGLNECASRFEGDADGDGDVDGDDSTILWSEYGSSSGGGTQNATAGGGSTSSLATASSATYDTDVEQAARLDARFRAEREEYQSGEASFAVEPASEADVDLEGNSETKSLVEGDIDKDGDFDRDDLDLWIDFYRSKE